MYSNILLFRVELIFAHLLKDHESEIIFRQLIVHNISISLTLRLGFKGCDCRCVVDSGYVI